MFFSLFRIIKIILMPVLFLIKCLIKSSHLSRTYVNSNGYVVIRKSNKLEHREIAKRTMGRELLANEVVHHINGNKINNNLYNLCLMDRDQHEFYHAWLSWKKSKEGVYPSNKKLKIILKSIWW
jgi:hypothetical protein